MSLPCATGEEPYSIAITLIEAGLMPSQLKIDAFDISEKNIQRCKKASYREHSFRGVDPALRDRFFIKINNEYHPDILIKAMVNFEKASVLDPVFGSTQFPYDVIFCRNLLIYFDRETQVTATTMLNKLLKPDGLLFVGHAETSIYASKWFNSQRYQRSFIVRKINDANVKTNTKTRKPRIANPVKIKTTKKYSTIKKIDTTAGSKKRQTAELDNELTLARQLANSGQFKEAEAACINYLVKNKQDSEVYYLLAIIQLAIGDEQKSAQYFKNVIYLEPQHYEALMSLSTLLANEGNEPGSARYRDRGLRVKNRLACTQDNL